MEKRELNELGDIIINGKLTIQELYDFAKENNAENYDLYFISRREDGKMEETKYTSEVTHFGKGWGKGTVIIHTKYKDDTNTEGTCPV
jgi:hypothetical protein